MDITIERAIKGFRLYNEAAGKSKKTTVWYESNLKLFSGWLETQLNHKPLISEVTADELRTFLTQKRTGIDENNHGQETSENSKTLSARTVLGFYSSLSAFFNWAIREELLLKSPMQNVARPKVPRFLPDPFSEQEIRALILACKKLTDRNSLRMAAMVLFLLDSGVRVGELQNLKLSNLELDQGRAKVMGKGAKNPSFKSFHNHASFTPGFV